MNKKTILGRSSLIKMKAEAPVEPVLQINEQERCKLPIVPPLCRVCTQQRLQPAPQRKQEVDQFHRQSLIHLKTLMQRRVTLIFHFSHT